MSKTGKTVNFIVGFILLNILVVGLDFMIGLNWEGSPLSEAVHCLALPFLWVDIPVLSVLALALPVGILLLPLIIIFMFIAGAVGMGVRMGGPKK